MLLTTHLWLATLLFTAGLLSAGVPPSSGGVWISTIDEPRQCIQRSITISGGTPPYKLTAVRGDDYQTEIEVIAQSISNAGEVVWLCNIQHDTSFALKVTDCKGAVDFFF